MKDQKPSGRAKSERSGTLVPSRPCSLITQRPYFRPHILRVLPPPNGANLATKPSTQSSLGMLRVLARALTQLRLVRYFQYALTYQLFICSLEKVKLCVLSCVLKFHIFFHKPKGEDIQVDLFQCDPRGLPEFLTSWYL